MHQIVLLLAQTRNSLEMSEISRKTMFGLVYDIPAGEAYMAA